MDVEQIKNRIIEFDQKKHPAWEEQQPFNLRIKDLPLYFLEFNHHERNRSSQSVTVTHYVPCNPEIIAISEIIKFYSKNYVICDVGCGNGFLGSLLAREGINVFGVEDRSYKQPQILNFYDKSCYRIIESSVSEINSSFDVALCSWMTPGLNLTPIIVKKHPKILIHFFSPDHQSNGSPTTGVPEAYLPPINYNFLTGWGSFLPKDFFLPLREMTGLNLEVSQQKVRAVIIYAHKDLSPDVKISPLDFTNYYDWDLERKYINSLRIKQSLDKSVFKIIDLKDLTCHFT
ncbi:MAG: hypothetical protein KJN62_04425 [Deltaproteobacteria bacterium]|nr:hypothetical protein [Deltaproteobacteria bacterium]